MKNRWSTYAFILLGLGLTVVLVASYASAYHYSAGVEDHVGLSLEEDADNGPSVELSDWFVGTERDCQEGPSGDVVNDPTDPVDTLEMDGFCGALLYHDELPAGLPDHWYDDETFVDAFTDAFEQVAPRDQDFVRSFPDGEFDERFQDLRFDVQPASYVGAYNLQSTDLRWAFFGPLQAVDPDSDREEEMCQDHEEASPDPDYDCGLGNQDVDARYGGGVLAPNAAQLTQDAIGSVDQRMNGWLVPDVDQTFIAFLEDDDGPISEVRLETIVDGMVSEGALDSRAPAEVCGFVDGFNDAIERVHPNADDPCPVTFRFVGENGPEINPENVGPDDPDPRDPDGYGDPCEGVLYACSTAEEQAWYAEWVCPAGPIQPVDDPVPDSIYKHYHHDVAGPGCWEALDSTDDYRAWHFVVAPTTSICETDQQPGFTTSVPGVRPFMAYDLDVFTPPQSGELNDGAGAGAWSKAAQGHAQSTAEEEASIVRKSVLVERNYDSSVDAWNDGSLRDTSQQDIAIERGPFPWCNLVDDEAENVADPWVNVLDAELERRTVENTDLENITFAEGAKKPTFGDLWLGAEDEANSLGAYGSDEEQDRSNRPGPAYMMPKGHVGMYFDEDDDGTFGPWTPALERGDSEFLHENGVFPMQWDADCALVNNGALGYGPGTGLIQAIYLPYETHFVTRSDEPGGYTVLAGESLENNVYLFFSGNVREAYYDEDHAAHDAITDLVERMTEPFNQTFGAGVVDIQDDAWWDAYGDVQGIEAPTVTVPHPTGEDITVPNPLFGGEETVPGDDINLTVPLWGQVNKTHAPPASDFEGDGCPSDRFENRWSFYHDCLTADGCADATMVTAYTYHAARNDGTLSLGGGPFEGGFDFCSVEDAFALSQPSEGCLRAWMDVDPIDNDASRTIEDPQAWSPLRHDPSFQ